MVSFSSAKLGRFPRVFSFRGSIATIALLLGLAGITPVFANSVTGTTGASAPVENRQPTMTIRYIIALEGLYPNNDGSDLGEGQPPNRTQPFLGEIKAVPFNFAPRGWAFCEGQTLPIQQNTALFSLLGTNFGGNGATTFNLPDLRGRVPIGAGQGFNLPNYFFGQQVGTANPVLTVANLPSHTHTLPGGGSTQTVGSGAALDNRQPALAIQFLIAANGEMMMAAFNQQPTGWTRCDGRAFPIAGHSYAYFNIGSTYGGDGFSSFAVPDPRGRTLIGDDNTTAWPIGKFYGSNDVVLSLADMPAHTHTAPLARPEGTGRGG